MANMDVKQFVGLQVFELIYLLILAFLPFVIAIREITYIILGIVILFVVISAIKHFSFRPVEVESRVVVITGCDSGFGNAFARRLDSHGFTVVAACKDEEGEGASLLKQNCSGKMQVVPLDVTDDKSVENFAQVVTQVCNGKGLWALVNNAGVFTFGDFELSSMEEYRKVMEVNVFGTMRMIKLFLPLIRAAKGRIVTIPGANGQLSMPGCSAFCMASHSLEALTEALMIELKPFGVKVIAVKPGNFFGATGLLNKPSLEKFQNIFEERKCSLKSEILSAYGDDCLVSQQTQLAWFAKSSAKNLVNVLDALEDAVRNTKPKNAYLVDGGDQLFDSLNIMIRLRPFMPSSLFEFILKRMSRITYQSSIRT